MSAIWFSRLVLVGFNCIFVFESTFLLFPWLVAWTRNAQQVLTTQRFHRRNQDVLLVLPTGTVQGRLWLNAERKYKQLSKSLCFSPTKCKGYLGSVCKGNKFPGAGFSAHKDMLNGLSILINYESISLVAVTVNVFKLDLLCFLICWPMG